MKLFLSTIIHLICLMVLICVARCGNFNGGNIVSEAGPSGLYESSSSENTTEAGKNINIFNGTISCGLFICPNTTFECTVTQQSILNNSYIITTRNCYNAQGGLTATNCTKDVNPSNGTAVQAYNMANVNGSSNSCESCSIANVSVCILPTPSPPNIIENFLSNLLSQHLSDLSNNIHNMNAEIPILSSNQNCPSQSVSGLSKIARNLEMVTKKLSEDVARLGSFLSSLSINNPANIASSGLNLSPVHSGGLNLGAILSSLSPAPVSSDSNEDSNELFPSLISGLFDQQTPSVKLPSEKLDPIDLLLNLGDDDNAQSILPF